MASIRPKPYRAVQSGGLTRFGLLSVADRLRSFAQGDEERVVDVLIIGFFSLPQHLESEEHDKKHLHRQNVFNHILVW